MRVDPRDWRPVLRGRGLTFAHPRAEAAAVRDVSLSVTPGQLLAVVGPNGAGKTTLLRLLTGSLSPEQGEVLLDNRPLDGLDDRERARALAVVPQSESSPFPVTVREMVAMGRYAHLGPWERTGGHDRAVVERALERCAVAELADRQINELSGGERQRSRIARALAQEAPILLLDEPTAGLDLRYRMELFHLLRELRGEGLAVLVITHDLNLAARFADRLLLLDRGRATARGAPESVLSREALEAVYEWPLRLVAHPGPGSDTGAPQTIPLRRDNP
ncbi:MAG: ABC transporter ATP-binding protein [Gemmatimonadota bacterium]|nr:ABC transporter ATP-binding protein [Gemmatimonadota bacterium]MDE2864664.1 ABC transporter ATP-binding protein [Gemmatimonadota bacterium]